MAKTPRTSRGYRNRNPGNIEWNPVNDWQGQTGKEPQGRFATFESHEYGIRALAKLLTTYQDRHGLRTIRAIISRWAPDSENQTKTYIDRVDRALERHGPDDLLDLHAYPDLRELVEAIIIVECGGNPYSAGAIDRGLELAGVPKPVETIAAAAGTGTGQAALTMAGVATAAATAAPGIQALAALPQWTGIAFVAAVAAVAALLILSRQRSAA